MKVREISLEGRGRIFLSSPMFKALSMYFAENVLFAPHATFCILEERMLKLGEIRKLD